jgi:hypothetical protein
MMQTQKQQQTEYMPGYIPIRMIDPDNELSYCSGLDPEECGYYEEFYILCSACARLEREGFDRDVEWEGLED